MPKHVKPKKSSRLQLATILLVLGICAGLLSLSYFVTKVYAKFQTETPSEITEITIEHKPAQFSHNLEYTPVKIKIGGVVEEEITAQEFKNSTWTIPDTTAAHLINSAYPYEPGNIIIYGHNTVEVFARLKHVKKTDTISLHMANGASRQYVINEIIEITPEQIQYLQPTSKETLTIYTCSGFMDSKRLIVRAHPRNPEVFMQTEQVM